MGHSYLVRAQVFCTGKVPSYYIQIQIRYLSFKITLLQSLKNLVKNKVEVSLFSFFKSQVSEKS